MSNIASRRCGNPLVTSVMVLAAMLCSVTATPVVVSCDAKAIKLQPKQGRNSDWTITSQPKRAGDKHMPLYGFHATTLDGKEVDFKKYKGDVLLIVNTASECGFTSQYKGLEALQKKFEGSGLKVLGFPCNQFGQQEPGDSKTIANFCEKNYGVTFQMFEKVDVNGNDAHPLYKYLTSSAPGLLGSEAIKWNFTKFLIDRKGNVVMRYAPNVDPESLTTDITAALK